MGEKRAPAPTKDTYMEQDTTGQDINISPAPFLPPPLSHSLSSLPSGFVRAHRKWKLEAIERGDKVSRREIEM